MCGLKIKILILTAIFIAMSGTCLAQLQEEQDLDCYLDSLIAKVNRLPADTSKLNLLATISREHYNIDSTEKYAKQMNNLALELKDHLKVGFSYCYLGWCEYYRSDYQKSCDYYYKGLAIFDSLDNKEQVGRIYNSLAQALFEYQDFNQADSCLHEALKIFYELNDTSNMAEAYRNLGYFCAQSGLFSVSDSYYNKALSLDLMAKNIETMGEDHYGIGLANYFIYADLKQDSQYFFVAKDHLLKAYGLLSENNIYTYMYTVSLLQELYFDYAFEFDNDNKESLLDSSLYYRNVNLDLIKKTGYDEGLVSLKTKDIIFFTKIGEYEKARKTIIDLKNTINETEQSSFIIVDFYNACSLYYDCIGDYKTALQYKEEEILIQKTCFNRDLAMRLVKSDAKVGYERTLRQRELKNFEENIRIQEKLIRRNITIWFVTVCFILMAILAIVIARSLARHRRTSAILLEQRNVISERNEELNQQKEEIIAQRDEIEEQRNALEKQKDKLQQANNRMTESIQYAKRIQTAIVPSKETFNQIFGDTLVYWKPLDIVSGDFYWTTQVGERKILAVADCTGHGVPGAFMSVLGISLLSDIITISDLNQVKPSEVLDQLSARLKKSLHQGSDGIKTQDGIDIALCFFDLENRKVQYAGAYRPLIIVRNKNLIEYKADKMTVGFNLYKTKPFSNNEISLIENDIVYLYTDGLADQFGVDEKGERSKLTNSRFKNLLLDISDKTFVGQEGLLKNALVEWQTKHDSIKFEQTDDQLLIGVKIL